MLTELAAKAGISKADAQKAVNAFAEVLHEQAKKGEKIAIVGLGTFSVSERAARTGTTLVLRLKFKSLRARALSSNQAQL